jgi:Protein of unknown function (DUF3379)
MMNCAQYRRAVLVDPRDSNPEMRLHRDGCRECQEYTERLLRFESRLGRAVRVNVPTAGEARVVPLRAPAPPRAGTAPNGLKVRRGWLAMAASVLILVAVAGTLWLAQPHSSLAADVVAHMAGEPQAWARTDIPATAPELAQALGDAHVRLDPKAGMVSYARSCLFRAHHVPHLVVQTEMGPVTVMVLVHESVFKPERFDEQGYHGVILPVSGHGSLAVLVRGHSPSPDMLKQIASRVQDALVWIG